MKRLGKEPRLLPNVMEAIAHLKEKTGSSQRKIIEHVSHILKKNKDAGRNVTVQIRRALDHGLHSGLIKQRSGKYVLGLDGKDYAIFKRFRKVADPLSAITESRRRGRRRRRRRSRRGRRRGRKHAERDEENTDYGSDSGEERSIIGTPEPMDRSRRRRGRRRGRRGRRRGRRRGHRRHAIASDRSNSVVSPSKNSSEEIKPDKRRSHDDNLNFPKSSAQGNNHSHSSRDYPDRQPSRNQQRENDVDDCGNPECLCNIKQEEDDQFMPRDPANTDFYGDDYLS